MKLFYDALDQDEVVMNASLLDKSALAGGDHFIEAWR
jgi:hypothetical protein